MDRDSFDGLTKLLATSPSRRAALGALLGGGLAGVLGTNAAKKDRNKKRQNRKDRKKGKGTPQVSVQAADCLSPGPSSNLNQCDFSGSDFSGDDLSGSSMVGTNFTNADLVETNLSSSNMKNATFRGANLTCADLSSSTMRGADFRGFAFPGRETNLTLADLSSSGCGGLQTNGRTVFCGTRMCDGSVRNDDCPPGFDPADACCTDADCGAGGICRGNQCLGACEETGNPLGLCICASRADGQGFACVGNATLVFCNPGTCPPGSVCVFNPCGPSFVCQESCPSLDPCVCDSAPASCGSAILCGDANP